MVLYACIHDKLPCFICVHIVNIYVYIYMIYTYVFLYIYIYIHMIMIDYSQVFTTPEPPHVHRYIGPVGAM